jgi:hypothetical protein
VSAQVPGSSTASFRAYRVGRYLQTPATSVPGPRSCSVHASFPHPSKFRNGFVSSTTAVAVVMTVGVGRVVVEAVIPMHEQALE